MPLNPFEISSIVEGWRLQPDPNSYGPRLDNMDSDFKSWCGIVYALSNRPPDLERSVGAEFPGVCEVLRVLTPSALINNLESVLMPHWRVLPVPSISRSLRKTVYRRSDNDKHAPRGIDVLRQFHRENSSAQIRKLNTLYRVDGKTDSTWRHCRNWPVKSPHRPCICIRAGCRRTFAASGPPFARTPAPSSHLGNQNANIGEKGAGPA